MNRDQHGCGSQLIDEKLRKRDYRMHKIRISQARDRGDRHLNTIFDPDTSVSKSVILNNSKTI